MKIVLISTDEGVAGMGVRTLSSCLIERGFETVVVLMSTLEKHFKKYYIKDLDIICNGAGLIGISCMTHGVQKAVEIKNYVSARFKVPVIIGGIHASLSPESLLDNFDMICHGEGEDMIIELAERLNSDKPYDDIPGLWIKTSNDVIQNKNIKLKRDLNDYPFPDYDFTRQFIFKDDRISPIIPDSADIQLDDFVVLGSRGCPHNCTYCCNNALKKHFPWLKNVRHYSIDYLIDCLKEALGYYPAIRRFWIEDDTFFAKGIDEISEFSKRYKDEIHVPFTILVSPWTFDENKIEPLIDAGMTKLIIGIQSGSESVNHNIYNRKLPNADIMNIVRVLHKYSSKVLICYDFIGMNPFETGEDLINTVQFIKNIPTPFWLYNNSLAFYPETDLCKQAIKAGLDIDIRVKHSEATVGYSILIKDKIKNKIFHFILLLMAGCANEAYIGKVNRVFLSDSFISFYRFFSKRLSWITDCVICILAWIMLNIISLGAQFRLNNIKGFVKKLVGFVFYSKLKSMGQRKGKKIDK